MEIIIKIGSAYYSQGFINIKKRYQEYFGDDNSDIKIYLGSWNTESFNAKINRRAQLNGTPRIMMGIKYTEYVQRFHKKGELLKLYLDNDKYPNSLLVI